MVKLLYGIDVIEGLKQLGDESVHCVVTSPPYWGLRSYGVEGQLGLEKTPEEFVAKMVEVFREVKRVLRNDGTLWLNLGDSYSGSNSTDKSVINPNSLSSKSGGQTEGYRKEPRGIVAGLKSKDLCGIPWRVAFALQADGWYLRSDIIWAKPNPMPESVTDRPTKAHEYIFLLTKSAKYYYDAEAIREEAKDWGERDRTEGRYTSNGGPSPLGEHKGLTDGNFAIRGRNKRTVWEIATEPYPEAHFATYPMELVKPCVMAGTSAKGCCGECGKPLERIVESKPALAKDGVTCLKCQKNHGKPKSQTEHTDHAAGNYAVERFVCNDNKTIGWQPTCKCNADIVPCTVLDPFSGSGTTGEVATGLGRRYIGIDINKKYEALALKRIGLFATNSIQLA